MKNERFPEDILDTEEGMFQLEISNTIGDAKDLVEASLVSDEIKEKCMSVLDHLVVRVADNRDKMDPYGISRGTVSELLKALDVKDEEQRQLFESVKEVIWKACYSVKGWEWPPKQVI